jgi:uncharacterized membrane protein (UPF0127 family)
LNIGAFYRGEQCVVQTVWHATNPWTRLRGLLGRRPLAGDAVEGLLIEPCGSVHTLGMTYPLDLVFLDRHNRVVDLCGDVAPWRFRAAQGRARKTLELMAGGLAAFKPRIGEEFIWRLH